MTDAECTLRYLVGLDVNMAFATGANGLNVGLGEPTHVKNPPFDAKLPGSWLVDLSHVDLSKVKAGKEWVELDGALLPSPFTPKRPTDGTGLVSDAHRRLCPGVRLRRRADRGVGAGRERPLPGRLVPAAA